VIWAGKPSDGLYRWEGRTFSRLTTAAFTQRHPEDIALMMARDGLLLGRRRRRTVAFQESRSRRGETEVGTLAGLNVISLAEDRDGGVWAGTREGEVWRQLKGNWVRETNYSQPHPVTAIVQDTDGAMWIGTEGNGLYRFRKDGRTHFGKGGRLLSDWIRTLYLDPEGALWIGTAGGGLSRCRENQIVSFTTREGFPDNTISQILEDDTGRLWLGSNRASPPSASGSWRNWPRANSRPFTRKCMVARRACRPRSAPAGSFRRASKPSRAGSAFRRSRELSWPTAGSGNKCARSFGSAGGDLD